MAALTPRGTATNIAIRVTRKVPETSGRIPYSPGSKKGYHIVEVRNSMGETRWIKVKVSQSRVNNIPMVVKTETISVRSRREGIAFSKNFCRALLFFLLMISGRKDPDIVLVMPSQRSPFQKRTILFRFHLS